MAYFSEQQYYNPYKGLDEERAPMYGGGAVMQPRQPSPYPYTQPSQPKTQPTTPSILGGTLGAQPNVPSLNLPPNPFGPGGQPEVQPQQPPIDPRQKNLSDTLLAQLQSFIGNPSRYNESIVGQQFESQRGRLKQGFDVERQRIDEDAARRGLFYSTEPAGRKSDVAGQQARAEADLLSQLTADQARTQGEDMQRAIQTILGYGGQQFGQQQATAQMNMLQDEQLRNFLLQLIERT